MQKKERNIQNPERYQVWLRSREKNKVLVTELDRQIAKKIVSFLRFQNKYIVFIYIN